MSRQIRIGNGFDAHRFKDGGRLMLCGVEVPYARGMEAHSDGDVAIHALCDAILGALALGDIGKHFPDSDNQFKGIASLKLLAHVMQLMKQQQYQIGNADITIIAQAPKLAPHIPAMRETLASALAIDSNCMSVKASTTERMGFAGREEGIATIATVVLLPQ